MTDQVYAPTDADVVSFRREGWLKLPGLLYRDELEYLRECYEQEEQLGETAFTGQQPGGDEGLKAAFAYQAHPNYRKMWRQSLDLRLRYEGLQPIVARLARFAAGFMGCDDVRVMMDRTFTKPSAKKGSRESVWHQDLPFLPVDRRGLLTFWIAVEDAPLEVGPLRFVPRSHRLGPLGKIDIASHEFTVGELLRDDDLELVGEPVCVPLRAGEATLHDGLTLHGSPENVSDRDRRAWTVVFIPAATLWTGAPHPNAALNEILNAGGMAPNSPYDHPQFLIA